ncbi:hypothetical protein [Halomarinibacterium sedimenti]|uniref:hypothetical protein n=1 Tax=Halomarinibacterium sedimenti TaxID=2857106 RepID=UPI0021021D51|nr:hypothetical protein [Halomarinibacterium sedimenti]
MITIEVIVFIMTILFGIVIYVRESKNNRLYRFFNKLMHSKELQMKDDNHKGFVYQQPFLLRLVWMTLLFLLVAVILNFIIPFQIFQIQYVATAIVGTLIGTYVAAAFFGASKGLQKENIKEAIEKGKDFVEELAEDKKDTIEVEAKEVPEKLEEQNEPNQKSARDRLKDKGMIK